MKPEIRNVYIISLEYGTTKSKEGITYNEMIAFLKSKGIILEAGFLEYYIVWFYRHFFVPGIHPDVNISFGNFHIQNPDYLPQQNNKKGIITAAAFFEYLKYIELKEARDSSAHAENLARWAIWISIGLAVIQILIPIFESHCSK